MHSNKKQAEEQPKYTVNTYAIVGEPGNEIIVFTYDGKGYMGPLKIELEAAIEKIIDRGLTIKLMAARQILANAKKSA